MMVMIKQKKNKMKKLDSKIGKKDLEIDESKSLEEDEKKKKINHQIKKLQIKEKNKKK